MQFSNKVESLVKQLIETVKDEHKQYQKSIAGEIPHYQIQEQHCAGASLVLNREALIGALPRGGVVAELGADEGDFSDLILRVAQPKRFHIVDPWISERYDDDKAERVQQRFADDISQGTVDIIRGSSMDVAQDFDDHYFDWIYIDADHSYQSTIKELNLYAPKIKPSGFLAGHDYVMGNWRTGYKYGVIEAVAEFCVKENWKIAYMTAEFVENNSFAITRI